MTALTDQERAILDLERAWWQRPGSKERVIVEDLGLTATRYYQLLGQLLDRPEALAHAPVTVNRLRDLRARRVRGRRRAA